MGAAIPCLGYPSRTSAVLALRGQGLSTREIARRIGIAEKTVSALEGSASRTDRGAGQGLGRSTLKQHTVCIDNDVLQTLRPHAERRDVSVNQLVRDLLRILADDSLVDALLDDDDARAA